MKITNKSSSPRSIYAIGAVVEPGESVEVDDDLGKSLCEQTDRWSASKSTKAAKADDKSEED